MTDTAKCTLCAKEDSPGFYTGCMINDGFGHTSDWRCDGQGNLTSIEREPCEYCGPGKTTGLPGNACENCMNTGLKYPTAEDLK